MAGAVSVVPICGSSISSTLSGIEESCSCNSRSYLQQASCSRSRRSYDAISLKFSSPTSRSLLKSGLSHLNSWSGRSHLGNVQLLKLIKGRQILSKKGFVGRIQASLLGVGAPEALVIAVVALLVFGPKGLAEVARTLGKSLKAFQPTIQELQQVSREFRSTLEQEIGLDELRNPPKPLENSSRSESQQPSNVVEIPNEIQQPSDQSSQTNQPLNPQFVAPENKAYTTEDYVRVTAEQAKALVPEELRKEAELAAWGGTLPSNPVQEEDVTGPAKSEEKKSENLN